MSLTIVRRVGIAFLVLAWAAVQAHAAPWPPTVGPSDFYRLPGSPPCRVLDTFLSPPDVTAGSPRTIPMVGGACAVPVGAVAVVLNVTVVNPTTEGDLTLYPPGVDPTVNEPGDPGVASIFYEPNKNRAKLLVVGLSEAGDLVAEVSAGTVRLIIDVSGYFLAALPMDDTATVAEDAVATTVDVLANDFNPNGDTLTITAVTQPANGTVVIAGDSLSVTYEPNDDYCNSDEDPAAPDTFTYTIAPTGLMATVSVTVTCADDNPVAVDDTATVLEDAAATSIDVLANDTDADGESFTIASATDPANGTVVVAVDGLSLTYEPDPNYCNTPPGTTLDTFTYTLTPGGDTATVSVTVTCVEGDPVAADDTATVAEDAAATPIDVLANDSDDEGDPFSIASFTPPANGTVVLTPAGPGPYSGLTYQPNPDYCNTPPGTTLDTFTYTLTPGGDIGTVTVTVTCDDDSPVAVDDATTILEDAAATSIDVLANDTDADGGTKTIASASDPANGTVVIAGDNLSLTYQPDANYCNNPPGTTLETFTYTLAPGGDSATVTVTVTCEEDNPDAVDDSATVLEDSGATTVLVLTNDTDVDGGPKTIASATNPANGTVVVAGDNLSLTYAPDANYCNNPPGTTLDTFQYTLAPGGDSATVTVTVTCVDDNPVAVADAATVLEDSGATQILVLANDTDIDAGAKTIASATDPANGTVVIAGDNLSLTYAPDANYCNDPPGTTLDTFSYTLSPGGSSTTVTVTVTCVEDNPVAVADAATVLEDSGATTINVMANDTDPDGGTNAIASATDPANGTVVVAGDSLSLSYAPDANYCNNPPGTTLDTFSYTLSPGGSSTTVTVTVTCVDDAPVAVADAAVVLEDAAATAIDVLANDTDIDGGPKTITAAGDPAGGTVVITGGGTGLTYQPNPNFCNNPPGTFDTFSYTLNGGSMATVSVSVTCVNDPPVLADATIDYAIVGNTQLRVIDADDDGPANSLVFVRDEDDADEKSIPSDVDGPGPLTVVPFSGLTPGGGDLVLNADGTFTYEPAAGFEGNDVIPFTVTDNGAPAATANGTMTITVSHTVWYVHDVVGANNPAAGDTGRSTNAFEDLEDVASVLTDNDYIYVFDGNSGTTPHGGLRINRTGVKLWGQGVDLDLPTRADLVTATNRPRIVNTADVPAQEDNGVVVDATAAVSLNGVEIRGLNISGRDNGIEVNAAGTNSVGVTISNSTVSSDGSTGLEGIDVNANSTGTTTVTVAGNILSGRGTVFDARTGAAGTMRINFSDNLNILSATGSGVVIDGSGGGTTTVTGFMGNTVHPNTAGTGIRINAATFDQTPGGAFETVLGGVTAVGADGIGNGVGGAGVVLTNIAGDLAFAALNVYADNGAGLQISGTGAVNVGGGTGTRVTVGSGMAIFEATGGPAVDVSNATIDLRPSHLESTTTTTGVSLVNVSDGTTAAIFSVGSSSSITAVAGASGPAFNVSGGNAEIKYGGAITNSGSGRAVSINSWSGDDAGDDLVLSGAIDENGAGILVNGNGGSRSITFSGGMDIDTGANEGFAATTNTNTGGLHITGTNTIDTTTAAALRVTNTPIGNSGLTFRSLTAGTASGSNGVGIVLDGTGTGASNGGLTVTGNGSAGTGGTIQHKTGADGATTAGIGIFLNSTRNVSLNWMQLNDFDNSAIAGRNVHGFSLQNSVINGTIGTTNAGSEGPVAFGLSNPGGIDGIQGTGLIRNTRISGGVEHNLEFYNQSGTMNLTIAGINAVSEGANPNSPADDVADCIIEENSTALGGDGIQIEMQGTATATIVVDRCLFRDNKSQAVQVAANNSSAVTVTIDESRVRRFDQGNEGFILSNGGDGDLTAQVSNNHVNGIGGTTIFVGQTPGNATASSALNATITGNVINQPTSATNHGISALLTSTVGQLSQARIRIDSNTVTNNSTAGTVRGILVDTPDTNTSPVFHATVTNNTVSVGDNVAGVSGIVVQGRQSTDTCASIGGNTVTFPNGNPGVFGLRARQVAPATYDLEQSASCTGTAAAVLACRNPGSTTEVLGTLTVVATGACLLPATP